MLKTIAEILMGITLLFLLSVLALTFLRGFL